MAAVSGQYSSSTSYSKRRVGFDDAINWEEENRRSCRGSESRRRKREIRKMESKQRNEKMRFCLEILTDPDHEEEIVQVCAQSNAVRGCILDFFVVHGVDEVAERRRVENEQDRVRRLLRTFQAMGTSNPTLNEDQKSSLVFLIGHSRFLTSFGLFMPASVVSSEESTPERTGQQPREQNRRDSIQNEENLNKALVRVLGQPEPVIADPPIVVRETEDI